MAELSKAIGVARYRLRAGGPLNRAAARTVVEGALVMVDGGLGCLQPWPEFGHAPLDEQLRVLVDGGSTALLEQALACAAADGAARREGRSLFDGLKVPPSHATLTDPDLQGEAAWRAGFRVWKAKCGVAGADGQALAGWVERWSGVRWRLDFNEVPTEGELRRWWAGLPRQVGEAIDFLEDPVRFDAGVWRKLAVELGVDLAVDRAAAVARSGDAAVLVVKPAWEDAAALARRWQGRVVVTSAMDHAIGQAWAAWVAAGIAVDREVDVCGLRTGHLFEDDRFSNELGDWEPKWQVPNGTGLGFDGRLDELEWRLL